MLPQAQRETWKDDAQPTSAMYCRLYTTHFTLVYKPGQRHQLLALPTYLSSTRRFEAQQSAPLLRISKAASSGVNPGT